MVGSSAYVTSVPGNMNPSVLLGYVLVYFAVIAFMFVCYWKIFKKLGYKGWYSLCPGFNEYCLYKSIFGDGWVFLLMWIPFYNIYLAIKALVGLSKAFGRSGWFALGLIFLSPVFYGILAFDNSEYEGNPYDM